MRNAATKLFVIIALLLSGATYAMEAGFKLETFEDTDRSRPITIDWWYPVKGQSASSYNYGMGQGEIVEGGEIAQGSYPLILLSHGAMGAARNYSWIAEHLARNGYIVAGISHFGESYIYGAENIDPSAVLRMWERPLDVSAAITYIKNDSVLANSVDMKRVGFIGHSSGGATALNLAGVLFDGRRMAQYCLRDEAAADRGCDYARSVPDDASIVDPPPSPIRSYQEPRIHAIIALDPALGPGFFDYSNVDVDLKMLVVGSVENDFLPFRNHAEQIARQLPDVETYWLNKGEGHFVYLNECDSDVEANGVPLCVDREGVSRAGTHDDLKELMLRFFNKRFDGIET